MTKPAITVKHVSKSVADRELLHDISFVIDQESLVSLIGPNGAGKSTLVNIMLGLDDQYTGTVTVADGQRIHYIPQQIVTHRQQLPLNVHEYLSVGVTPLYSGTRVTRDFATELGHVGMDSTVLQQPLASLSGGERQRVAIARALLTEPTILVLDEPLAAVDFSSRTGLYELIRHLQKDHGMTVVLVSHDTESVLSISDKVLCLNVSLHSDCHPAQLESAAGTVVQTMHHHC